MTKKEIPDFQGVILCGSGHLLHPYVEEEVIPKAMLPIAARPMIYYPLTWFFQAGITDVIVVAQKKAGPKLQNYLGRVYEGGKAELVLLDDYEGTREALMAIKGRLEKDVIVVSCDFLTDFPIARLVQHARVSDAKLIALLATPLSLNFGQQPKAESNEPKHRQADSAGVLLGLDPQGSRLLSWVHREDLDDDKLMVRMSVLCKYPNVCLRADLSDVHCYVLRRDLLNRDEFKRGYSLREEVIPRLVRHQFGRNEEYVCEAMIVGTGYCLRTNTISAYAEASKQLTRLAGAAGARLISQAAEISAKAQIGADSLVGDHTIVGDRSSVKRSVVGNHVAIGNNVKISNSIIMDYVVVEDNCKIEGTVIGMKAAVREKTALKDCDVGIECTIDRESAIKGEQIILGREMMDDHPNHK